MDISEDQLKSGEIENKSIEHKIDYILDRYDTLGSLVKHGIVDKDIAIETYAGTSALRFWYRLVTYIKAMRRKRGYYATNFEDYVRKSYNYFQDRNIEVWFYSKCEESIELIGYFTERLSDKEFMPQEI